MPTVGAMRSRHSRSVGKWIGVRMAAGVLAVSELIQRRLPVDAIHQPVRHHVRHAHSHRAVIGVLAQVAHEDALELAAYRATDCTRR